MGLGGPFGGVITDLLVAITNTNLPRLQHDSSQIRLARRVPPADTCFPHRISPYPIQHPLCHPCESSECRIPLVE
jgi:hypothetical protein